MEEAVEALQQLLGYRFEQPQLLVAALTHKSYAVEAGDEQLHNERLEFLGDAVLDLVVAQNVYSAYAQAPEGELTRLRAEVVSATGLATLARQWHLGHYLRLGRGERRSGGRSKSSLLANTLEAVVGALFLDGGYEQALQTVEPWLAPLIAQAAQDPTGGDYKTALQEELQARYGQRPHYQLLDASGPEHARTYTSSVLMDEHTLGTGSGPSKKNAEQAAARQALEHLRHATEAETAAAPDEDISHE